jgi:hypothetical protein
MVRSKKLFSSGQSIKKSATRSFQTTLKYPGTVWRACEEVQNVELVNELLVAPVTICELEIVSAYKTPQALSGSQRSNTRGGPEGAAKTIVAGTRTGLYLTKEANVTISQRQARAGAE